MTLMELQELVDQEFKFVALDNNDNVKFAVPIPGEKAWQFASEEQLQDFIWDAEEIEACEAAWEKYIKTLPSRKATPQKQEGKKNRTRAQAEKVGAITTMPEVLALPTLKLYLYAISTVQDHDAYLQPITADLADNLTFSNGTLYFKGMDASRVDLVQYYDKRPQAVANLDLPTLRALYSIILEEAQDTAKNPDKIIAQINDPQYLSHHVKIYIPKFLEMLGYGKNYSEGLVDAVIAKIMSYSRILGIMREHQNGREYISHYPVMQLSGHDGKDNTIQFSSPYMNKLIMTIMQASIKTDRKGNPKLKPNGAPFSNPSHSYLIKSSIAKEKNKRAVEIVCIVVTLVERTGDHLPHIKAQTIIDRCPDLKNALEAASGRDRNQLLKRAFSKAWELLPKQTRISEVYKDFKFPSPDDCAYIPTMSTLGRTLEFPHGGKIKGEQNEQ